MKTHEMEDIFDLAEELHRKNKTSKWIEPEGQDAIGKTIYGRKNDADEMVANALAWFALEEVARYLYDK